MRKDDLPPDFDVILTSSSLWPPAANRLLARGRPAVTVARHMFVRGLAVWRIIDQQYRLRSRGCQMERVSDTDAEDIWTVEAQALVALRAEFPEGHLSEYTPFLR